MAPQLSRAEAEGWPAGDWAARASQNTLIMSRASCEDLLVGVDQEVHSLTNHHIAHVIGDLLQQPGVLPPLDAARSGPTRQPGEPFAKAAHHRCDEQAPSRLWRGAVCEDLLVDVVEEARVLWRGPAVLAGHSPR